VLQEICSGENPALNIPETFSPGLFQFHFMMCRRLGLKEVLFNFVTPALGLFVLNTFCTFVAIVGLKLFNAQECIR
jgi:hypothetical protein